MDVFSIIRTQIEKDLFSHAMKGEWNKVVETYWDHPWIHNANITKSGDTALHLAVSDGQEEIVEQLVDAIFEAQKDRAAEPPAPKPSRGNEISDGPPPLPKPALRIKNERGNTPLHLAAALGSVSMCHCIAKINPKLIVIRNQEQKTPLFLAALNGKKDAFLCLDDLSDPDSVYKHCRGSYGDTFLHAALNGEYFDLTFQIICRYGEKLVNLYNEKGFTPLHVLATKPSAFESGSRLGRFDKIIYVCTIVDELKEVKREKKPEPKSESESKLESKRKQKSESEPESKSSESKLESERKQKSESEPESKSKSKSKPKSESEPKCILPENYQSCFFIFEMCQKVVRVLHLGNNNTQGNNNTHKRRDMESQETDNNNTHKPSSQGCNRKCFQTVMKSSSVKAHDTFPPNYQPWFEDIKLIYKAVLIILGCGSREIKKVQDKKQQHVWTLQILDKLLPLSTQYEYEDNGLKPQEGVSIETKSIIDDEFKSKPPTTQSDQSSADAIINNQKNEDGITEILKKISSTLLLVVDKKKSTDHDAHKNETPILVAAKYGIMEIVKKVLDHFPVAIHDMNSEGKNIVLLAVENRQTRVFQHLLERNILKDSIFSKVDTDGNSAVHLAAKFGEYRPWLIPGAALQMQWEIKWYEFVKYSMPLHFFQHYNNDSETPKDIFTKAHADLVKQGGEWLTTTSNSCSVVAALIATVAFATASTVPGGNSDSGKPNLENQPAFDIFAISSLVALCFSVTAMVMFLAILTSRHQERDFRTSLPRKLLLGLTSLFISITAMLISFCAGHFFVLKDKLKFVAIPVYAVTCLPVTFFAIAQFPLYFDLMWAMFKDVPQRSYRVVSQEEKKDEEKGAQSKGK